MSTSNITQLHQTYQIKITLEGIRPPIWRRLLVDNHIPLARLHEVIQIVFGWEFAHLHQFSDGDVIYGEAAASDFGEMVVDEETVALSSILKQEKSWFRYEYDFGDSWLHKIVLEKILPGAIKGVPVQCIKGKRNTPPEDCGGVWGYQHLLEVLADPKHDEYEDMSEWVGEEGWDGELYEEDSTNDGLQEFFRDKNFKLKRGNDVQENMFSIDLDDETIPPELAELFSDPEIPTEAKHMLGEILNIMSEIHHLNELLDETEEAFDKILQITKEPKVKRIVKKILKKLE